MIWRKAHASDLHKVKNNLAMTVMLEYITGLIGDEEQLRDLQI